MDWLPRSPTKDGEAVTSLTSVASAIRTGLRSRPLADTVRDTLTWFQSLPAERQAKLRSGRDPKKEADTLRA